jgi:signal peptidase II
MKIPRIALAAYGFAILIVVVDQLTKAWIMSGLDLNAVGRIPVLPPVLNFTWVENRGVSFGLFGDGSARWMLSAFSVAVAGVLGWWALKADRRLLVSANVIDRIRFGFVVDFLDFSGTGFFPWVFNVADSAITIGVILLILDSVLSERAAKVGVAAEKS